MATPANSTVDPTATSIVFGPFRLSPMQRLLIEAGTPIHLGSRALDMLVALLERPGELVSKEELMAKVWQNTCVVPTNIAVLILALRRALGDGLRGSRYVVNIPGRGYCFVAAITVEKDLPSEAAGGALLILLRGDTLQIEAEGRFDQKTVEVIPRREPVTPAALPESLLHTVIRTRQSVILDDALAQNPFSADEYICQKHARSVLCLPLVKQDKLIGGLYLENNLASHVFTAARISVLEVLASQAAISLENARLYNDLREREARIRRLVDSNIIGIVFWDVQGRIIDANQAFLDIVGYAQEDLVAGRLRWTELTPAEWRDADERAVAELKAAGTVQPREKEYFHKDGSRVPVLLGATTFGDRQDEGVAFVLDLTERKHAEEALRKAQADLAHVNRVATIGQLTASITHEVNQPITAAVTYALAARRLLSAEPPNFHEVDDALSLIVKEGNRAGEVVGRIRALIKKAPARKDAVEINDAILEVIALTRTEAANNSVSVRTQLAGGLPGVQGDRVQLQQVLLNLIINAVEAMRDVGEEERELLISTRHEPDGVSVEVRDSGPGLAPEAT